MNVRGKVIRICYSILFVVLIYESTIAQKTWDGEAGDGFWETALNWADDLVPSSTDDIILDNSIIPANYVIAINGTIGTVQCRSIRILPNGLNKILLSIPSSNINGVALNTTGTGYTIELNAGAELVNASGASSGVVLAIADSMKIKNGARYIHRTSRGNATILNSLSSAPGTESGIVEFDVKVVTGSYIVSMTNRVFGSLVFSSWNNGGPIGYVSNGTNPVSIRGDLFINSQVSLSIGFDDTIRLKGNLHHEGNILNLSNNGNPTVLQLEGNLSSNLGTVITETNTAQPVILFKGGALQQIALQGSITNDIIIKLRKQGAVQLTSPLRLPHVLELRKGILKTDTTNLLTLDVNGKIIVDSTMLDSSFIDGPVRKLGLNATDYFLFPVGKENKMRWIELKNATGDVTVEFFKANPYAISSIMNGIDHISSIEYWTVESLGPASARVELSFDNVNSGGVTDMSTLRVAQLNGSWFNQGNTGTTGSAGGSGSVISNSIEAFGQHTKYFTLASTVSNQNPLPSKWIKLAQDRSQGELILKWSIPQNWHPLQFTLERSDDGIRFERERRIMVYDRLESYEYRLTEVTKPRWYRIAAHERGGEVFYSNVVFSDDASSDLTISLCNSRVQQLNICISSKRTTELRLLVCNLIGQVIASQRVHIQKGRQQLTLMMPAMRSGNYYLVGFNGSFRTNVVYFYRN